MRAIPASVALALAAYNAGPAPVGACDCVPQIPETQTYVAPISDCLAAPESPSPRPWRCGWWTD